eukprot:664382-Prymnesium_polylepis.1
MRRSRTHAPPPCPQLCIDSAIRFVLCGCCREPGGRESGVGPREMLGKRALQRALDLRQRRVSPLQRRVQRVGRQHWEQQAGVCRDGQPKWHVVYWALAPRLSPPGVPLALILASTDRTAAVHKLGDRTASSGWAPEGRLPSRGM